MKRLITLSFTFLALLNLTACSTVTNKSTTAATPETKATEAAQTQNRQSQQMQLSALKSWRINGKIAVISAKNSGSASVTWLERNNRQFDMSFMGPLGGNSLQISGEPGATVLKTSDGKIVKAGTPEELLQKQWGWNVPVSNLRYWIKGMPVPGVPADTRFDANHRLAVLSQSGWTIQYLDYTTVGTLDLPSRLTIQSPALTTKIAIYHWQIG